MSDEKYYAILTDLGQQLITAAYQAGEVVTITQMAFGDAGQAYVPPDPGMTELVSQIGMLPLVRGPQDEDIIGGGVNILSDDYPDSWIYEAGLFDADGNLIIYASYPPTLIPPSTDSVKKGLSLDIGLIMSATDNITVYVDPEIEALTRTIADGLYLQILNNLSEIAAAGEEAQQAARNNLRLGTGATYDVQLSPDNPTNGTLFVNGENILVDRLFMKTEADGEYAFDVTIVEVNGEPVPFVQTSGGMNIWFEILEMGERVYSPNNPPPQQDLSGYLQDVQLGAEASQPTNRDEWATSKAPAGNVLTGVSSNYNDSNWELDTIFFKPVQEMVDGAYKTIAG